MIRHLLSTSLLKPYLRNDLQYLRNVPSYDITVESHDITVISYDIIWEWIKRNVEKCWTRIWKINKTVKKICCLKVFGCKLCCAEKYRFMIEYRENSESTIFYFPFTPISIRMAKNLWMFGHFDCYTVRVCVYIEGTHWYFTLRYFQRVPKMWVIREKTWLPRHKLVTLLVSNIQTPKCIKFRRVQFTMICVRKQWNCKQCKPISDHWSVLIWIYIIWFYLSAKYLGYIGTSKGASLCSWARYLATRLKYRFPLDMAHVVFGSS